jgi:hypothetical protein
VAPRQSRESASNGSIQRFLSLEATKSPKWYRGTVIDDSERPLSFNIPAADLAAKGIKGNATLVMTLTEQV